MKPAFKSDEIHERRVTTVSSVAPRHSKMSDEPNPNASPQPPVQLNGLFEQCVVCGHRKPVLTEFEYAAIRKLTEAFPDGVSRDELIRVAGPDAHAILTTLRKKDTGWASVIMMPSRSGRGVYRLISPRKPHP